MDYRICYQVQWLRMYSSSILCMFCNLLPLTFPLPFCDIYDRADNKPKQKVISPRIINYLFYASDDYHVTLISICCLLTSAKAPVSSAIPSPSDVGMSVVP